MGLRPILNISSLAGKPEASDYGLKVAGCARLLQLAPQSPFPYKVPDGWAIPPPSLSSFSSGNLRIAFDALTSGTKGRQVLMARGSSLHERPGKSPTEMILYDPTSADASFDRFQAAVEGIQASDKDMGILAMRMLGFEGRLAGSLWRKPRDKALHDRRVFGLGNISFVADTHNPVRPEELYLSVVHGLGTRAVAAGSDAVLITADRATGLITSFLNRSESALRRQLGAGTGVFDYADYRQTGSDYFDMESGRVVSGPLYDLPFMHQGTEDPRVICGTLISYEREGVDDVRRAEYLRRFQDEGEIRVGFNPFDDPHQLGAILGILQYLSTAVGCAQVEGAISWAGGLHLYQLTEVPVPQREDRPLSLEQRHLFSSHVLGTGKMDLPLVWFQGVDTSLLERWDREFAETGYILLTHSHNGRIVSATPNARVRLSLENENLGSHAVALTRLKIQEDPKSGYIIGSQVSLQGTQYGDQIGGISPDEIQWNSDRVERALVFRHARIDSNGRELAVEILKT